MKRPFPANGRIRVPGRKRRRATYTKLGIIGSRKARWASSFLHFELSRLVFNSACTSVSASDSAKVPYFCVCPRCSAGSPVVLGECYPPVARAVAPACICPYPPHEGDVRELSNQRTSDPRRMRHRCCGCCHPACLERQPGQHGNLHCLFRARQRRCPEASDQRNGAVSAPRNRGHHHRRLHHGPCQQGIQGSGGLFPLYPFCSGLRHDDRLPDFLGLPASHGAAHGWRRP